MSGEKVKSATVLTLVFLAVFVLSAMLYHLIVLTSGPMFGPSLDESVPLVFFSLSAALFAAEATAFFVLRLPLSIWAARAGSLLYFIVLAIVVLGKSVGVTGLNFNPLDFDGISAGTILNAAIFIFPGAVFREKVGSIPKAVVAGLSLSIFIEMLQAVFSLGVADVHDVIANALGVWAGAALYDVAMSRGFRIIKSGTHIAFERPSLPQRRSSVVAYVVGAALVGALCSFAAVPVFSAALQAETTAGERDHTVPISEINSATLLGLNRSDKALSHEAGNKDEGPFCILNGEQGGAGWMERTSDGICSARGSISQIIAWMDGAGNRRFAFTLCSTENVNGVLVRHGFPVVVTEETALQLDQAPLDYIEFSQRANDLYTCMAVCEFTIEKGWAFAKKMSFDSGEPVNPEDIAVLNYFRYDDYLQVENPSDALLELDEGQEREIRAHLVSTTEISGEEAYCTFQFYRKFEGVPIAHAINVVCEGPVPEYPGTTEELSAAVIRLENGRFVMSS